MRADRVIKPSCELIVAPDSGCMFASNNWICGGSTKSPDRCAEDEFGSSRPRLFFINLVCRQKKPPHPVPLILVLHLDPCVPVKRPVLHPGQVCRSMGESKNQNKNVPGIFQKNRGRLRGAPYRSIGSFKPSGATEAARRPRTLKRSTPAIHSGVRALPPRLLWPR